MGCQKCSLMNPLTWVVAFLAIPLLVFAGFLGFGLLSIFLTFSAMILSTILFTSSKNKPNLEEEEEEDHMEQFVSDPQPGSESTVQDDADDFTLRSSESECLDQSSSSTSEEDSEAEWTSRDNVDHSPDWSDGSISDEESLIEIALPSGHYVDHSKKEEPNKFINLQQPIKFQDLMPQSIFQQQLQHSSLMELLAEINEMNEEDNLIEIDISMGSIKCSRIGIKA